MNKHQLARDGHQITYLEGCGNYTYIYFLNAPRQLYARTLSHFEQHLPQFVRIHKGYLVNPAQADYYTTDANGLATLLIAGHDLPISRRRFEQVRAFFRTNPLVTLDRGRWYQVRESRQFLDAIK